jgi:hypothetical protein
VVSPDIHGRGPGSWPALLGLFPLRLLEELNTSPDLGVRRGIESLPYIGTSYSRNQLPDCSHASAVRMYLRVGGLLMKRVLLLALLAPALLCAADSEHLFNVQDTAG